jgi:hypothetical protein
MPPSPVPPAEPSERRNLYRILHVQPEAPLAVIKASYRALMSSLRAHPDLGGDTARAAEINAAYAVLRDPDRRAAYDQSLPRRAAPAPAPVTCLFCGQPQKAPARTAVRCGSCAAPLTPAPAHGQVPGELIGRRRGTRVALEADASLHLPGQPRPVPAVLRDVSVTGLSLACLPLLEPGRVIRVTTARFDALARVVDCRIVSPAHLVRAELLTLQVARPAPA